MIGTVSVTDVVVIFEFFLFTEFEFSECSCCHD